MTDAVRINNAISNSSALNNPVPFALSKNEKDDLIQSMKGLSMSEIITICNEIQIRLELNGRRLTAKLVNLGQDEQEKMMGKKLNQYNRLDIIVTAAVSALCSAAGGVQAKGACDALALAFKETSNQLGQRAQGIREKEDHFYNATGGFVNTLKQVNSRSEQAISQNLNTIAQVWEKIHSTILSMFNGNQ